MKIRVSISWELFILFYVLLLFFTVFNYSRLSRAQICVIGGSLRKGHELLVKHHLVLVVLENLAGVIVVKGCLVRIVLEGEMVLGLYWSSPIITNLISLRPLLGCRDYWWGMLLFWLYLNWLLSMRLLLWLNDKRMWCLFLFLLNITTFILNLNLLGQLLIVVILVALSLYFEFLLLIRWVSLFDFVKLLLILFICLKYILLSKFFPKII